jgi:hypothetical protein
MTGSRIEVGRRNMVYINDLSRFKVKEKRKEEMVA